MPRLLGLLVAVAISLTTAASAQPLLREGRGENEVVLIHGLGADASIWDNVLGFLRGSTQTFAYELHGHGTTRPLAAPTITAEAAALGEWLRAKDLPYPTLVGHGLGGMVALQFALDHPADVRRVILIDATPRQLATAEDRQELSRALLDESASTIM
jgi:pimeloyl-ACP methyl ester carboxylesterase